MHEIESEQKDRPKLVFLYGSGRSGTTWMEERIVNSLNADVVFEPLNASVSSLSGKYAYRYLNKDDVADELETFFKHLIEGKLQTLWTRYRILPARLIPNRSTFFVFSEFKAWLKRFLVAWTNIRGYSFAGQRDVKLIKMIRANLLFPWIINKFPDALHLFIIRHPASVIESRMRLDHQAQQAGIVVGSNDWSAVKLLHNYYNNIELPEVVKKGIKQVDSLETLSEFECHCVLWCVENKLAFEHRLPEKPVILYYEHLIKPEHQVWEKLAHLVGKDKTSLIYNMNIPSQQASGEFDENKQYAVETDMLISIAGKGGVDRLQYYLDLFEIEEYTALQQNPTVE